MALQSFVNSESWTASVCMLSDLLRFSLFMGSFVGEWCEGSALGVSPAAATAGTRDAGAWGGRNARRPPGRPRSRGRPRGGARRGRRSCDTLRRWPKAVRNPARERERDLRNPRRDGFPRRGLGAVLRCAVLKPAVAFPVGALA